MPRLIAICGSILMLVSCSLFVSNDHFGESWKGSQIQDLQRQWKLQGELSQREDGMSEYRFDIFHGKCSYWFTTDQVGKIVSYRWQTKGGTCKPIG